MVLLEISGSIADRAAICRHMLIVGDTQGGEIKMDVVAGISRPAYHGERMLRIEEYRAIEELESLRQPWDRLWRDSPGASYFQSLDWLQLYWRKFAADQRLRVFTVESGGTLVGIVPLVLRKEATRAGIVRVLTFPLQDWGSFYAPIGPHPTSILAAALKQLAHRPRDWDLLDLRWVDKSPESQYDPAAAMTQAGYSNTERLWRETAVVDFEETWEQYLASRSGKFRSNLRRAETAARALGKITFERYRPSQSSPDAVIEPDWRLYEECEDMAARSWQATSETGTTITHSPVRSFFRELFGIASRAGAMDLNLLRLDGRVVAFSYNLIHRGRLFGLRIGFDAAIAAISPGRILLARSLRDSFSRGDVLLDLGSESMGFKHHWLSRTVGIFQNTHYPRGSLKGQLLRTKHALWLRYRTPVKSP